MISRCKQLDLDDAEAGMVLAADVLDHQGSVLLPAGAPLTEALLTSMRRRAIDSVSVVDDAISSEDLARERERVDARMAKLFRDPAQNEANGLLRAELTAYRMESLK